MTHRIAPLAPADLEAFLVYLEDHVSDNGIGVTPLFMPRARSSWKGEEVAAAFREGLAVPLDQPSWRRAWTIRDEQDTILGHIDLRARPEPHTEHRVLLGMGVHREHRGRGLGRALVEHVIAWAQDEGFAWIDLEYLDTNPAAARLYERSGFVETGRSPDKFRIDGQSIGYVHMARRLGGD